MPISLATWNINSVRLRIGLVEHMLDRFRPDVLCLQEIKCENGLFPFEPFRARGYEHIQVHGQRGYHGVAIVSRLPLEPVETLDFNGTGESRHLAVRLLRGARRAPVLVHNVYAPAGGDIPDPDSNPKFRQKLDYFAAMARWSRPASSGRPVEILVGDLNIAPLEHDVWSHRQMLNVVSHTPVEVDHMAALAAAHGWHDVMRAFVPPDEKLFTWWSYRSKDWRLTNRGRRLDHVWVSPALAGAPQSLEVLEEARGWERPSDHVPVIATFDL